MNSPRALLKAWGIRPKRHTGQHFLNDSRVGYEIVSASGLTSNDVVLEIGAGLGALTIPLALTVKKVFAVEKDKKIALLLRNELLESDIQNVTILEKDILRLDLKNIIDESQERLIMLGNLPYHISSQILFRTIAFRHLITAAIFMFQKELAERIKATSGSKIYGRLSVAVQYCASVHSLLTLDASHFYPRPKVDSELLLIDFDHPPNLLANDEAFFFRLVRAAFGRRRKTLRNALKCGSLGIPEEVLGQAFDRAGIDPMRRPETLSVQDFVILSNVLSKEG